MSENEIAKQPEYGMTKEQEEELQKDDRPAFISVQHGVSEGAMKGIDGARAGDFLLNGRTRIAGSTFGPGFRAVPILQRPQALLFEGNQPKIKTNDMRSPEWLQVAALVKSFVKGAKLGYEFLLALPDYKRMGILFCANQERFESAPKILEAMHAKRCIQITTIIKGAKNSVKIEVQPAKFDAGDWKPTEEDYKAAMDAFEAYKQIKPAPQGGPRR